MIGKYKKKPVEIEAIQLTDESVMDVLGFMYPDLMSVGHSILSAIRYERCLMIPTLEGNMKASFGDYIIRGVKGEFYPCRKDIFEETYENA